MGESAQSLVDLPFEDLLETEVAGASAFVREVTDAPSAVSVVTAEEIQLFGYRTLAEILENLPGLSIDFDGNYFYPVTRGYGVPGQYFGRFMLLIDGYPAADNMYNQIFLGDDGLLDVSVIDRVEYAPGPGAAVYGNNAFLGVIHVITRKGRDVNGGELAASWGANNDRKTRLNLGGRTGEGTDWLLSLATRENDVKAWSEAEYPRHPSNDQKLFFKARRGGWWIETALARRQLQESPSSSSTDIQAFWQLGHDVDWDKWRGSFKLYQGGYDYLGATYVAADDSRAEVVAGGAWWGGQAQLASTAWAGHRVAFGVEYRADQRLRKKSEQVDQGVTSLSVWQGARARTLGFYLQDEFQLTPQLDVSLSLRHDRRSSDQGSAGRTNPRLALMYRPGADTTFKLSHGTASRWASADEKQLGRDGVEQIQTSELVVEHGWPTLGLRAIGSLYRYRLSSILRREPSDPASIAAKGMELTLEQRWKDVVLRASYAFQRSRGDQGVWPVNSPGGVGKLLLSVPLGESQWRASLAMRAVGQRKSGPGVQIPGYGVADLTVLRRGFAERLDLSIGVRNLFDRRYGDVVDPYFGDERGMFVRDGSTYWLQMEYRFR